jgi:uncharacterized damage-inducible protein DinB
MKSVARDLYLRFARYNRRANLELFDALSPLTEQARKRETGSWFGSIHGILNHIIIADLYWLNRYRPIFPESTVLRDERLAPCTLSWKHDLFDHFDDMKRARPFVDECIIAWFQECPDDRSDQTFEYSDSAGKLRTATAGKAFEFLFVHQIHHRGQVSQALDAIGLPNNIADNGAFLESAD